MKKKQIISLIAASVLTLTMFVGCGKEEAKTADNKPAATSESKKETSNAKLNDGTFKAEYDNFDDKGWKATVTIEVKDGKIAKSDFNSINKDGKFKRDDEGYNKAMEDKSKTSPKKYEGELATKLVEKQDADKVDAITGATHSTEDFKKLAKAAIAQSQKGDTNVAKVAKK